MAHNGLLKLDEQIELLAPDADQSEVNLLRECTGRYTRFQKGGGPWKPSQAPAGSQPKVKRDF